MFLHFNLAAGETDSPQLPKAATELGHQPRTHLRYQKKKSGLSNVMCAAKLIVCDEISIARKGRADPFVTSPNVKPFGGLTVLICG